MISEEEEEDVHQDTYTSEPSGRISSKDDMMKGAPGNASMVALKTWDDITSPRTGTMASQAAQKLNIRAEITIEDW